MKSTHFTSYEAICSDLYLCVCAYNVVLRRQWPRQKGTMVRILKRSTEIPADFEPATAGYTANDPEVEEEDHEQKWGLSDLVEEDNFEPHEG